MGQDKIKKAAFWIGVFPLIIGLWGTISMTVYHIDVVVEMVSLAATKDADGLNGLDKYLMMYDQHQLLWRERIEEITE